MPLGSTASYKLPVFAKHSSYSEQFQYINSLDSLDENEEQDLLALNRKIRRVKHPAQLKASASNSP